MNSQKPTCSSCSGPTASRRRTSSRTLAASPCPGRVVRPAGEAMAAGFGQVGGLAKRPAVDDGLVQLHGAPLPYAAASVREDIDFLNCLMAC